MRILIVVAIALLAFPVDIGGGAGSLRNESPLQPFLSAVLPGATAIDRETGGPSPFRSRGLIDPDGVIGPPEPWHIDLIEPPGLRAPAGSGVRAYLDVEWDGDLGFTAGVAVDF